MFLHVGPSQKTSLSTSGVPEIKQAGTHPYFTFILFRAALTYRFSVGLSEEQLSEVQTSAKTE